MKKSNKRKKAILILYSYIIMLISSKTHEFEKISYFNDYTINCNTPFATYNNKDIYIGKRTKLFNIITNNPKNIYIFDERNNYNPNMKIYNSCQIKNLKDILRIIEIVQQYEKQYPSNWYRTTESMINEWIIHNICYNYKIEQNRTKEVDLDNNEEEKYLHIIKSLIETIKFHMTDKINRSNYKKVR